MSDAETPAEGAEEPKKKGLPIVGMLVGAIAPVVTGLGAAGLAFFLTPAPKSFVAAGDAAHAEDESATEGALHAAAEDGHGAGEKKEHGDKKKKKSGGHDDEAKSPGEFVFVPMDPLVVTLGPEAAAKYLKITMSIEAEKGKEGDVSSLMPKLRDVINGYLRAVDESDLAEPSNMSRIRAQMLRRLQLVAPDAGIANILITDFVLT